MTEARKKDIATSLTVFLFLIVGTSGILMFFHVLDEYTQTVHETLGLAFVLASLIHVYVNWKPMKRYFSKKSFVISGISVLSISLILVYFGKDHKDSGDVVIDALMNAPVTNSFVVLNGDYEKTKTKLEKTGIVIDGSATIEDISRNNGVSSRNIVEAILQK